METTQYLRELARRIEHNQVDGQGLARIAAEILRDTPVEPDCELRQILRALVCGERAISPADLAAAFRARADQLNQRDI